MPSTAIGLMRGLHDQITDVDDTMLDILGYTRAEFEAGEFNWRAMTPPEFIPLDDAGVQQALRIGSGGFTLPYRKAYFRKDGSRVPVLVCCAFVPNTPAGTWMGYVVDLSTAHPQQAQPDDVALPLHGVEPSHFYLRFIGELVRERTRLHAIFDTTTSMMWSVDRSLRLTTANAAFQERLRNSVGRTVAVGDSVLLPEYPATVREEWTQWYERVLAGESIVTRTEYRLGTVEQVFAHALTPYRDEQGTVIGVAGVSHDISALVLAERRAADREAELIEAQRLANVGSWDWDRASDTVTWTASMCEIFGWPADQPVPPFVQHAGFYAPESWRALLQVVQRAVGEYQPYELELELRVFGQPRWILARGEPRFDRAGSFVGIHGVVLDITERRQAEEARRRLEHQLVQSQKMQALGQLAGGVAHDFNNIITSMLLQLGTIREDVEHLPYVSAGLDEVERAARRASALTQQLLMFSRRQAPDLKVLEVNGVVHDFLRMLRRLIGEQYHLEFDASNAPLHVHGDRGMLEQVIMNLAVNARDAMAPGGTVTMATTRGVVQSDALPWPGAQVGPYVEIRVTDTGCGIPQALQSRLFEPFFTTKPAGMGTGLGLATTYGIVAQHGGWVEFESEEGKGTTFRVRVPELLVGGSAGSGGLHSGSSDGGSLRNGSGNDGNNGSSDGGSLRSGSGNDGNHGSSDGGSLRSGSGNDGNSGSSDSGSSGGGNLRGGKSGRVLLVEDEPALRMLVQRTLGKHGYEVVAAGDVAQARRLWHSGPAFDMVLSDIVLPGEETGIDLVQSLRAMQPALKVLFMTGYTAEMDKPNFSERVGAPVLGKPFDIASLLASVASVMGAPGR